MINGCRVQIYNKFLKKTNVVGHLSDSTQDFISPSPM